MSYNMKDLTCERFGRLTVICSEGKNRHGSYMWLCECDFALHIFT